MGSIKRRLLGFQCQSAKRCQSPKPRPRSSSQSDRSTFRRSDQHQSDKQGSVTVGHPTILALPPTSSAPKPVPWSQAQWLAPWYPWYLWGFTQPSQAVHSVPGTSDRSAASTFQPPPVPETYGGRTSQVQEDPGKQPAEQPIDVEGPAIPAASYGEDEIMEPPNSVP